MIEMVHVRAESTRSSARDDLSDDANKRRWCTLYVTITTTVVLSALLLAIIQFQTDIDNTEITYVITCCTHNDYDLFNYRKNQQIDI